MTPFSNDCELVIEAYHDMGSGDAAHDALRQLRIEGREWLRAGRGSQPHSELWTAFLQNCSALEPFAV